MWWLYLYVVCGLITVGVDYWNDPDTDDCFIMFFGWPLFWALFVVFVLISIPVRIVKVLKGRS